MMHHSPLAMVEWDNERVICGWNSAAAELFSFFEDEVLGRQIDQVMAEREIANLTAADWTQCDRAGILRSHVAIGGKKICRWYHTPFMVRGERVSTLSTIVEVSSGSHLANQELRAQLQSRTKVLKHATARLKSAINDRQQTHAALSESEKRIRKLTANVPGILFQFKLSPDLQPSFPFVSATCESLLGLLPETAEANAEAMFERIHPEDRPGLDQSIAHSAKTLEDWSWEGRFWSPEDNNQVVWIKGVSRPEKLPDNSIVWDGLLIDITPLKATEANLQRSEYRLKQQTQQLKKTLKTLKHAQVQLVQNEKMSSLGQLVGGIAHEINNPVNFIHGNLNHVRTYSEDLLKLIRLYQAHYPTPHCELQTLTDALDLDYVASDLPKLVSSLQEGTERIRNIVLSLRNFSRLDETGLKAADLHEGLENTLMLLSNRLKETVLRPEIKLVKAYEKIPQVSCYANQLNQVFMNILSNAIDAIDAAHTDQQRLQTADPKVLPQENSQSNGAQPQIILQTFSRGDRVVILIANSGPPISKEIQAQMFDPFFTTKPVGQGTGMGLAMCYQAVVNLHKGALRYTETAEGKPGFTIEIPIVQVTRD